MEACFKYPAVLNKFEICNVEKSQWMGNNNKIILKVFWGIYYKELAIENCVLLE